MAALTTVVLSPTVPAAVTLEADLIGSNGRNTAIEVPLQSSNFDPDIGVSEDLFVSFDTAFQDEPFRVSSSFFNLVPLGLGEVSGEIFLTDGQGTPISSSQPAIFDGFGGVSSSGAFFPVGPIDGILFTSFFSNYARDSPDGIGGTIVLNSVVGESEDFPVMPGTVGEDGRFRFDEVDGLGQWFDPVAANGFLYETDGLSLFTEVGLPAGVPDADGSYTVIDFINGSTVVPAGGQYSFPVPVGEFSVLGIDPSVDGEDPLAFPTFLAFDEDTVSFTMTPIPEPGILALAILGLAGSLVRRRR